MNGWSRMFIIAVLLASGTTRAKTGEGWCSSFADLLRHGDAEGTNPHYDSIFGKTEAVNEVADGISPTLARLHATKGLRSIANVWEKDAREMGEAVSLIWFKQVKLGAIKEEGGHMGCIGYSFFSVQGGEARMIEAPRGFELRPNTSCAGSAAVLLMRSGTPLLVQNDVLGPREMALVASWENNRWNKTCKITAEFGLGSGLLQQSCKKGVDCEKIAAAVVRVTSARIEEEVHQSKLNSLPTTIQKFAANTRDLFTVPAFGSDADIGPDSQFGDMGGFDFFAVPYENHTFLGVLAKHDAPPGYLTTLWEPSGDKLAPVGVFFFEDQRGKLKFIKVENVAD